MTHSKPKISFNLTPPPQPDQPERAAKAEPTETAAQQPHEPFAPQTTDDAPLQEMSGASPTSSVDDDWFDREAWERDLRPPPSFLATQDTVTPDPAPAPEPAEPKLPPFGTIGFMGQPEPRFLPDNAKMLGLAAAAAGICLFLGLTVFGFAGDDVATPEQASFSAPVDVAQPNEEVTRTAVAQISVAEPVEAVTPAAISPAPPPQDQDDVSPSALEVLGANKLRMLRESVLAGVYTIERFEQAGVERIRLSTHNAPLESEESSAFLLDAATRGELEMSKSLMTTEQDVDVETLMFNLVHASLLQDPSEGAVEAALDMSRRFFEASPARTESLNGMRYYTVQQGDSLAYIALQFYGKAAAFKRILAANFATLQSPDQIQTGQRLIIPR